MKDHEKIYFVVYDIADNKRWRKVYKMMQGYGEWVQLSVFQCQLSQTRYAQLLADCDQLIHHGDDHIVIIDVGTAEWLEPRIVSLGKRKVSPVKREVVIV
ncbi:CRISPR-associated endonuclease Cas2 [Candidatus Poribacteria bacterium]|nr:CRISPR-associated endonuclease Cas2 [Gammaproteobacteria bacterium]MYF99454.1 CRISPR-associated endonuclease Cas2 [Candidatus Poribacteria bacterium]